MAKHMAEARRGGAGTRGWAVAYLAVVLGALAALAILVPVAPNDPSAELQELTPPPELIEDGHPNVGLLADAGDWFDDHFAFRQQLISLNARLQAGIFGVSATNQVVVGSDGWLYYGGTLADYQRIGVMSAAMARNAAFNLRLVQNYVESRGARFALAIGPDKNALYPEAMPWWRPAGAGESSLDVFRAAAGEAGLHLVDLQGAFEAAGGVLYMKTDTHWDGAGARLAYDTIMAGLGYEPRPFDGPTVTDEAFIGDLEAMLYPSWPTPEPLTLPEAACDFAYVGEKGDVEDDYLLTQAGAPTVSGGLLMYRDSFGNTLLPYFAATFDRACFSKLVPYDLAQLAETGAQTVVIERAERHLDFFATDPAAMAAPRLSAGLPEAQPAEGAGATVETRDNGPYLQVDGLVQGLDPAEVNRVVVGVELPTGEAQAYVAFRRSVEMDDGYYDDGGYRLYIPRSALGPGEGPAAGGVALSVIAETNNGAITLARQEL